MRVFHYFSGEIVMLGDRIRSSGRAGRVVQIIQPGSQDAADCSCPDGAVCTEDNDTGGSMLLTPPDRELWEDLDFISRSL